jgi:hypothetical protein
VLSDRPGDGVNESSRIKTVVTVDCDVERELDFIAASVLIFAHVERTAPVESANVPGTAICWSPFSGQRVASQGVSLQTLF